MDQRILFERESELSGVSTESPLGRSELGTNGINLSPVFEDIRRVISFFKVSTDGKFISDEFESKSGSFSKRFQVFNRGNSVSSRSFVSDFGFENLHGSFSSFIGHESLVNSSLTNIRFPIINIRSDDIVLFKGTVFG